MFCPKCKYTSFDYLKKCPKCGQDWTLIRQHLNLDWLVPPESYDSSPETESVSPDSMHFSFENHEDNLSRSMHLDISEEQIEAPLTLEDAPKDKGIASDLFDQLHTPNLSQELEQIDTDFFKEEQKTSIEHTNQFSSSGNEQDFPKEQPHEVLYPELENDLAASEVKDPLDQKNIEPTAAHDEDFPFEKGFELELDTEEFSREKNSPFDMDPSQASNPSEKRFEPEKQSLASQNIRGREVDLSSLFEIIDSEPENKK
jgi:hypothetical protein